MKVMVIGPQDADSFADNVADTLERTGHEVLRAGPARRTPAHQRASNAVHVVSDYVQRLDEHQQQHVIPAAAGFQPDLTLTMDVRLRPKTVAGLQQHSSHVALWFPDHVSNLGKHQAFLAPYNRIYLKMRPVVDQLSRIHGLPVRYLPEAANSAWHVPLGEYGTEPTVLVAGNIHPTRAVLLERLLDANIPLSIYGSPLSSWMDFPRIARIHTNQRIVRQVKAAAFRSARAVLNNLHPAELAGSNCRLFEATGSGAAVLTEWRPGMEDLFVPEDEVLPFSDFDELVDRCRYLLAEPERGRPVGDAAASRTAAEHTYEFRLSRIFSDLGLD